MVYKTAVAVLKLLVWALIAFLSLGVLGDIIYYGILRH